LPEETQRAELATLGANDQRDLVDALMRAWEHADVAALVDLLTEDVRFTMPPLPAWFSGRDDVGRFFIDRIFPTPWLLMPLWANGQPAFLGYRGDPGGDRFRLAGINVLSIRAGRIDWIASFLDPGVHRFLGLSSEFFNG
jgi:RNA polymerase sigma-70 factor (ECF subfamily)